MRYKNTALFTIFSASTILLSGCLSTKPYQPPKNAAIAKLTYDIDPATFAVPSLYVKHGFIERVDIQLTPSRFAQPKTIYMYFNGKGGFRELNTVEANKQLTLTFEQKAVKGLGEWPMICSVSVPVTLKPNRTYVLKGKAEAFNKRELTNILLKKYIDHDRRCQVKILDELTKEIVADSGMKKFR